MLCMRPFLFFCMVLAAASNVAAQSERQFEWETTATPVPLLELFTSEGCSSCPPAERWIGELRHDPRLWRDFVPVAWHVNYWDRLGWPDKFAAADYTARQYAYADLWRARTVYTPGLVRGGEEWRIREGGLTEPGLSPGGVLSVRLEGDQLAVDFVPSRKSDQELEVHVVRLGGGISSDVRRGENRGKQLHHEFLVLDWTSTKLKEGQATLRIPPDTKGETPAREALAVWVSAKGNPTPLQAIGGWIDPEV